MLQAEGVVTGAMAVMAVGAMVIRHIRMVRGPRTESSPFLAVVFESGADSLTVRAGHAGTSSSPFFPLQSSGQEGLGAEPMDEIAKLELGRTEELVVGFAGE